jgi:phage shock protein C
MDDKLYRSNKDFWFAGVCGGIAEYFEFDYPILIRIMFVMLFISPAIPAILLYMVLWVIIKEKK